MIRPDHSSLSVVRQCRQLSISRSSYYHTTVGESAWIQIRLKSHS